MKKKNALRASILTLTWYAWNHTSLINSVSSFLRPLITERHVWESVEWALPRARCATGGCGRSLVAGLLRLQSPVAGADERYEGQTRLRIIRRGRIHSQSVPMLLILNLFLLVLLFSCYCWYCWCCFCWWWCFCCFCRWSGCYCCYSMYCCRCCGCRCC